MFFPGMGERPPMKFIVPILLPDVAAIILKKRNPFKPRIRSYLRKAYGRGWWRKMKGTASVRLPNGALRVVELHWYEAHGIGQWDIKIKRYLDEL
jgi:hypothetical protein